MNKHFRILEKMYLDANINRKHFAGVEIQVEDGQSTITLTADSSYFHALGGVHGAVYFKLLDDAAFFAVASKVEDVFILTASLSVDFLRPVQEGKLKAVGKFKKQGNRSFKAESVLFNAAGELIGKATGTFAKTAMPLPENK